MRMRWIGGIMIGIGVGVCATAVLNCGPSPPPAETVIWTPRGAVSAYAPGVEPTGGVQSFTLEDVNVLQDAWLVVAVACNHFDANTNEVHIEKVMASTLRLTLLSDEFFGADDCMRLRVYALPPWYEPLVGATVEVYFDSANPNVAAMTAWQVRGLHSTFALDRTKYASGASATASSGATEVPVEDHEGVFGVVAVIDDAVPSGAWSEGWHIGQSVAATDSTSGHKVALMDAHRVITTAAAQTAQRTLGESLSWGATCVTFKVQSSGELLLDGGSPEGVNTYELNGGGVEDEPQLDLDGGGL